MDCRKQYLDFPSSNPNAGRIIISDLCPNCHRSNNPITKVEGTRVVDNNKIFMFSHKCTSCHLYHWSIQEYSFKNKEFILWIIYPNHFKTSFSKNMIEFSPNFIKLYNQAELAEQNNNFELAGMGYRASLEVLIADYAIKILKDDKAKVSKLNLNNLISHYFKEDKTSMVSSDVVRIIGNNFVHWNKDSNFDIKQSLEVLKSYLNIFIDHIKTILMIQNPPVER